MISLNSRTNCGPMTFNGGLSNVTRQQLGDERVSRICACSVLVCIEPSMQCFVRVESFGGSRVRRAPIRKIGKQIPMRAHTVRFHSSVGQEEKEVIEDVVG